MTRLQTPAGRAILAMATAAAKASFSDFIAQHGADEVDMEALAAAARRAGVYDESHRAPAAPRRLVAMGGVA